jgi:hypothetical protein
VVLTDVCSCNISSSIGLSPESSESSDSDVESEVESDGDEAVNGPDREDGSAKCLEPETESRSG